MIALKHLNALLDGNEKHFILPPDLMKLVNTRQVLDAARREAVRERNAATSPNMAEGFAGREAFDAAFSKGEPPEDPGAPIREAAHRLGQLSAEVAALVAAVEIAEGEIDSYFASRADEVFDHLRPALEEVLDQVAELAPKLAGITDAAEAIRAGKTATAAWAKAEELAQRYSALRSAQGTVTALRPRRPRDPRLAERRTPPAGWMTSRPESIDPLGLPIDPIPRLLVLATELRDDVWLPSLEQQEARLNELAQHAVAEQKGTKEPAPA